jgi:hypothetical protein
VVQAPPLADADPHRNGEALAGVVGLPEHAAASVAAQAAGPLSRRGGRGRGGGHQYSMQTVAANHSHVAAGLHTPVTACQLPLKHWELSEPLVSTKPGAPGCTVQASKAAGYRMGAKS